MTHTIAPAATPQQPAKAAQSPLFDLLARSWTLEAAITDVALDRAGKAAGFALADGRVALMPLDDPESPLARMRVEADSGRSTIRPREKPVAQPILTPELATRAPLLAPSNMIGLVAAGRDGRIHRVTPRGQVISLCNKAEPIFALAADGLGRLAIARDGRTDLHDEDGMARQAGLLTPGPAHALAFAPDDRSLAVALKESLIIGQPRKGYELFPLGGSGPIGFSADGRWLVGCKFRAAPTSVTFCRAADAVFASGAFRAAGWSLATPPFGNEATGALKTGRSGLVLIDKVAAHPARDLIALGTADGAVAIAQAGRAEEMPLRQADGAAVTALAWSADGLHLAIGTANGEAALVTLPPQLFK
jgi:hypothetical protein